MCRSGTEAGPGQKTRCPHEASGSAGVEYLDERIKKSLEPSEPPTEVMDIQPEPQKFSEARAQVVEQLKEEHPAEVLEKKVKPEEFNKFHQSMNRMINESDMSDHDKMIARKQWNRAHQEVEQGQVKVVTLATWQKVALGTILFALSAGDRKGHRQNFSQKWTSIQKAVNMSVSVKDFYDHPDNRVFPPKYDSYEDYEQDMLNKESEALAAQEARNNARDARDGTPTEAIPQVPVKEAKAPSVKAKPVSVKKEKVPVKKQKVAVKGTPVPVKKGNVPVKEKISPKTSPVAVKKTAPADIKQKPVSVKKTAPSVKKEKVAVKATPVDTRKASPVTRASQTAGTPQNATTEAKRGTTRTHQKERVSVKKTAPSVKKSAPAKK